MKRVIIVDDDALVRASLEQILIAKQYDVVATGQSGEEAIALYTAYQPDILLMDIRMTPLSGLEASRSILQTDKHAKILFITTFNDEDYIADALRQGCAGYILKENIGGIVPAVEAVLSGQMVFGAKVFAKKSYQEPNAQLSSALSSRENDILTLVAEGLNNAEIAKKLYLSEGTVRNYVSNLLDKLDLRDRTQLAVFYYKQK